MDKDPKTGRFAKGNTAASKRKTKYPHQHQLRLTGEQLEALTRHAKLTGQTKAQVLRTFIDEYL